MTTEGKGHNKTQPNNNKKESIAVMNRTLLEAKEYQKGMLKAEKVKRCKLT
jgi:hypothetical protein